MPIIIFILTPKPSWYVDFEKDMFGTAEDWLGDLEKAMDIVDVTALACS